MIHKECVDTAFKKGVTYTGTYTRGTSSAPSYDSDLEQTFRDRLTTGTFNLVTEVPALFQLPRLIEVLGDDWITVPVLVASAAGSVEGAAIRSRREADARLVEIVSAGEIRSALQVEPQDSVTFTLLPGTCFAPDSFKDASDVVGRR